MDQDAPFPDPPDAAWSAAIAQARALLPGPWTPLRLQGGPRLPFLLARPDGRRLLLDAQGKPWAHGPEGARRGLRRLAADPSAGWDAHLLAELLGHLGVLRPPWWRGPTPRLDRPDLAFFPNPGGTPPLELRWDADAATLRLILLRELLDGGGLLGPRAGAFGAGQHRDGRRRGLPARSRYRWVATFLPGWRLRCAEELQEWEDGEPWWTPLDPLRPRPLALRAEAPHA